MTVYVMYMIVVKTISFNLLSSDNKCQLNFLSYKNYFVIPLLTVLSGSMLYTFFYYQSLVGLVWIFYLLLSRSAVYAVPSPETEKFLPSQKCLDLTLLSIHKNFSVQNPLF